MGFFKYKWGESGDGLEVPPSTTQADGTVSEQEGFGSRYSLLYDPSNPELSNPNAIPLHRKLMNAIFNKITGAIQQYQKVGVPDFITSTDNDGVAFPYAVGSVCLLNGIQYRSLVSNNTTTPPSSSWEKVAPSVLDSTNTLISSPSVAKNAFFTGVVTGKYLTIKIAGLATATAGGVLDFGGMTVKIMQDDRDANGVTVPDSWLVFIKGDMKNGVWENAQAINLGTDSTLTLPVSFTRTATDAFIEFDFTTIGTSYMSVVVEGISTYIIGSYSPVISITMQSSKLGTLGTDATRSIVRNASLVDLAGKQPLNSILTGVTANRLPIEVYTGDLSTINIGASGVKFFKISTGATNTPITANTGDYLLHYDYDGVEISLFQEYYVYVSARRFWRSKYNGGWSAWKEYQSVIPTNSGVPNYSAGISKTFAYGTVYTSSSKCRVLLLVVGSNINGVRAYVCSTGIGTPNVNVGQVGDDINSYTRSATITFDVASNVSYTFDTAGFSGGFESTVLTEYPLI